MKRILPLLLLAFALPASAALTPATVSTTGSSVTTTVLPDQSTVVKFLADGSFTVPDGATARLLLVGGGGAGGYNDGGGGGAGGLLESNAVVLAAGTYTVAVGAGGVPAVNNTAHSGNGGDTVLSFGGTELGRALGGGGGGSWGQNGTYTLRSGAAGGSGGGCAGGDKNGRGVGGAGTEGQGHDGAGEASGAYYTGGGGGAGEAGHPGTGRSNPPGDGGAGLPSDITGEEVWYAGGGGGGGWADSANGLPGGVGGKGGGGNGARNIAVATRQGTILADDRNEYEAECGVDGLGGGGGGGNNTTGDLKGRPGGSGVLVVRLAPVVSGSAAEPFASVASATDGPASVAVRAMLVTAGDGASTADLSYAVATSAAALDSATPVAVASGMEAGDEVSFTIPGLAAGTTHHVRLIAENENGVSCNTDFTCLPYVAEASVTTVGAAREFDVGQDRVAVFNQSAGTMTFTLAERSGVELLLVGGGGAGGSTEGGGGGAGGFLHLENAILDAGTYTVAVGAGGVPTSTIQRQGGNGGNTTLSLGNTALYTAHGGGGGGGYASGYRNASAGGSGGGAGIQAGFAGASTTTGGERGHAGGANDKAHSGLNLGSGGGGAGEQGSHADYVNVVGGKGGDGLPCSITGEEVWYAGGGGAGHTESVGGYVYPAGRGGRGGGGMGCRTADDAIDDYERGTDGLGGGGGGGRSGKTSSDGAGTAHRGAPGGSGTLIVRWKATADATARATVDSVVGSVGGAIVSGSVQLAGAADATLEMAVGPAGGSLGAYETLGTGLKAGERFILTLSGLATGTAYDYAVRVVSGGAAGEVLGAATGSFTTFTPAPARLSADPAGATKTMVGTDTVYAFSTPGTYTFTVSMLGRARFLMVGGGGAGGSNRAGGGGAGGFIEIPTTTLEPGTYTVVVGAGGAVSSAGGYGGDGEDTVLRRAGDDTDLYTAHGGGGGAWGVDNMLAGRAGGSGGGGNSCAGAPSESTAVSPELGHPGGKGSGSTANGLNNAAAGGGGAGGAGGDGHSSNAATGSDRRQGGAGGAGVASDITGETLYYAGGGGGGCWTDTNGGYKGLGGSGVGGDGGGWTTEANQNRTSPTAGADGTGSGGGGGFDYKDAKDAARQGAAGGCGAFILRLAADDSAELPEVVIESLEAGATSADVLLALRNSGSAATADLSLLYGMAEDALDLSVSVATGAAPGVYAATVSGLSPGRTWFFAPVASNAGGVVTGAVQSVTLPAAGALPAGDGSSGLWQISKRTTAAAFPTVFTNATLWADATVSNLVAGTIAANTRNYVFEDPATGLSYVWPGTPVLYAYRGWIYLEGGRTYAFGSRYADSVYLAIDGETVLYVSKSFKTDSFGTFATEEAGWHEIEVRVGHTTETFGPDGDGNASWANFGVAFNANGSTAPMPESGWTPLLDDGSGSLLRPSRPEARTLSLVAQGVAGGSLTLGAKVGSGANPAHAYLVYGAEDLGTLGTLGTLEALGALESLGWTVSDLGAVAASAETTDLVAQVASWGSAAKVARIVLETEGQLAWTEPVTYAATALPAVSDALASDYALGDRATFRATVSGGTGPYAATLLVGADASSLAVAATTSVAEAGAFSFGAVAGLAPGAQHFYQVVVTDANGATARSEVLSFVTPGASRIYEFADVNTEALWQAGNPFENRQRTLVAGGTVSEYGAGETTVRFLRNQGYYGFPAAGTTTPHEGESLVVTGAGAYTLPVLLDWDWDVRWNWDVSNATETASWGPTAGARAQGWGRTTTIIDATKYTWAGGDGLWNDSDKWSPDGVWDDIAGYPRRGSYAAFPAGTAVVSVPDTGITNRFTQLSLLAGADVTFQPAPGATDATLRMQTESSVSTARNYGYSMAKNAALRFKGEGLFADFPASTALTMGDTDGTIEFADGVRALIGNSATGGSISANGKSRALIAFRNGANVRLLGGLTVNGEASQAIVDDAVVIMPIGGHDNSGVHLRGKNMNGKATLVIKGANPILQVGRRFRVTSGDTSDKTQYVDFEVPEGGWGDAPIRTDPSNAYKFGADCTANYKIALRIPETSPAVVAGESLDVPLVRWPGGINETYVALDPANLPHPATDGFFQTTDPVTGQITVWAHLVGQADTAAPQASDFRVRSLAQTGANLSFVVIPGSGGSTSVSVEVLDANGDAVAGATVSPASATFSAAGTNLVSVAGLDPATDYTLRVTLNDGTNPAVTADFAFNSLDDWASGRSDTAASVVQDGPYTVWTFTDTTPHAGTFTVTRGGLAEILVVGGGGAGGAGYNADNDAGGGGGGGGQVISTTAFLASGIYPITVGKGGAKGTARAAGAAGSVSAFGDMIAAGGGGGGYNTTAVLPGAASGGGGASGKAGGTAGAGFPGGAGVSKAGGGGGGGAGGAGSPGVSKTGGAGGAGVTNAISGYPAVYGAGGGGGGSGTYASGTSIGGAAGGDTAGVGGSRNVDFRYGTATATMAGAPGFGGGGGGGCGSNGGDDNTRLPYYGGAGGSGTVIIRMRTETAAVPAPQAALKAAEAGEADWTASLVVYSLGEGASSVEATLLVARDGAATTNDFALGTVSETGAATLVATGLAPSSDYAGVLLLDNGLAGGTLEIPVSFTTADPAATTVPAGAVWDYGDWTGAASDFRQNLLRTKTPEVTIAATGEPSVPANVVRATNGAEDDLRLSNGRLYTWTWDDPVYLTAFRIFYKNSSTYLSAVNVASVEARGADGTWTTISPEAGHYLGTANTRGYLVPADGATALWDQPAYGIRFTSDGNMSTADHYVREIEADGIPVADAPADLSISSLTRTAAGAKALVAFSHALQADATVTAWVAAAHGGTDAAAWTAATNATAEAGALSQNFSIPEADLAGMNYLRFSYEDENHVVRWSETVFLPDVEILASLPPVVRFVAVRAAEPGSVTLAASLVDAGSGAENDRANLSVRYAAASNAVESAAAHLVAANAPEGETDAVLAGLLPDRLYWAQFVASNAGGDSGVSEVFSFSTAPDEFADTAASAANVWDAGAWSTATVELEDNLLRGKIATEELGAYASYGSLKYLTDGIATATQYYGPGPGTSITFELGGAFSLAEFRLYQYWNDFRKTISVASLEWRDEAGAWHRIPGSALEYEGGTYNYACLRPADGAPYLAVGATAFRYTQGFGGTLQSHPMREMELFGVPSGACRFLTVEAASWSGGTLSATVSRPMTNAVGTIHAVSGETYHGTNAVAWAADGSDAVFGTLAADEASAVGTFAPAAGAAYVRFYEADSNGVVVAWSDTIPADAGALRVVDGGVEADGDTALFPIRVVSAGTGTLSVKVLLADDPDFTNATEIAVSNPAVGTFSVSADVDPGATYWYRVVAETTDGGLDETPVASFSTRTGSVLALAVSQSGVTHRSVVLRGTLDTLGAGVTTLEILTGDSANALSVLGTVVLERTGDFSVPVTITGMPRTVYYQFRTVNVAPGGATWESLSNSGYFTTVDAVTYTWKAGVTEGAWNDPANWTPSAYPDTCTGYPDNPSASVDFPNGTVATVTVPGKYRFYSWNVYRQNLDVTFVGNGPDVSGLGSTSDNMGGGAFKNCNWTFSGLSVTEKDGVNFGDTSSYNSTLRFTDGAVASFGNNITGVGSNMWVVVDNGATLSFRAGGLRMGMKFGGLAVDDGTVGTPILWTDYNWGQTTNQEIRVSGAAPRIEIDTSFRNNSTSAVDLQNADTTFLFSVPASGWENPAIYSENEGEMFAGLLGTGAGGYAITIDPASPIFQTSRSRTARLVAWKGGIDTAHVTLPAPTEDATVFYTYGWPSVLTEPENAGDAPTGVAADLVGKGGKTMLLIW